MNDIVRIIGTGVIVLAGLIAAAAVVAGLVALSSLIIWLLWNALVPALITNGPTISYFQAVLVNFVLVIFSGLFKGATS